jgi:hypothetical protein
MRVWAPVAFSVVLASRALAAAGQEDDRKPAAGSALAVPESQLRLGPYAGFSLPRNEFVVPELPRFETEVDVHGRTPDDAMFEWWQHFRFESSIYGRGINIQNPMPGGGFNILPLFDWAKKKMKKGMKEPDPDPEPAPPP